MHRDDISAAELRSALDEFAIRRLQSTYGDVITRRAWAELDDLFVPDAPIELDLRRGEPLRLEGAAALGRMVERAVERFEFFEFALLNSVIDLVDGGNATGRLYMWELRQVAESGRWTNAFGLYRDAYARGDDGRWRIASRRYSSLARSAETDERPDGLPADYEVFDIPV